MVEFYNSGLTRRKKKRNRYGAKFLWLMIADIVVLLATFMAACTIVLIIAMQYINPSRMWVLSILTLGAPIIYVIELLTALYWIVRWKWKYAAFSILFVLIGSFYIPLYYKVNFSRQYDTKYIERNFIKAISYNVANGDNAELVDYVSQMQPNIICLQEFLKEDNNKWSALGDEYTSTTSNGSLFSCDIFTRYKIIRHGDIDSIPRYNAVWADLKIGDDTIRVINLHLQSTSIHPEDTKFIQDHEYIFDAERENKFKSIIYRLVNNTYKRAAQVQTIRKFIDLSPYRMIVCGDMNDVPMSYAYHLIAKDMKDAFQEAGNGYAYTFNGYFRLLQIDHFLVSPDIDIISYEVDNSVSYSDHYPIITRLKIDKDKRQ